MDCHFISDDRYFLQGVREMVFQQKERLSFYSADAVAGTLRSGHGDIVVVNVRNIARRKHILRQSVLADRRLIILLCSPRVLPGASAGAFPWVMADHLNPYVLTHVLQQAASVPLQSRVVAPPAQRLFQYLGAGHGFAGLHEKMQLTRRHLYALKLSTLRQYGLDSGHPAGVLLCRDLNRLYF